jgi:hypothetical protein
VSKDLFRARVSDFAQFKLTEQPENANIYNGHETAMNVGSSDTGLLAAGKGHLHPHEDPADVSSLRGDTQAIRRLALLAAGDWVILQAKHTGETPCVPADPRAITAGEPIWAAGFPDPAFRVGAPDSWGQGLYVTHGKVASDIRASAWLGTLNPGSQEVFTGVYQPGIEAGELLLSDMDSQSGLSGGAVIDAKGRLVAVNVATGQEDYKFRKNSTLAVSVLKIFNALRAAGVDPSRYFSCR